MSATNHITLVGRMGQDPEYRTVGAKETALATFSMVTTRYAGPGKEPESQWHRIKAWGRTADFVNSYCGKADMVVVLGELVYGSYTNNEGEEVKTVEIHTRDVSKASSSQKKQEKKSEPEQKSFDEDLPF